MSYDTDLNQLVRVLRGQGTKQPQAARQVAENTTRDMHPTEGSRAIMAAVAAGTGSRAVVSLNIRNPDGSLGAAFCWDVPGFGLDEGEWAPPA